MSLLDSLALLCMVIGAVVLAVVVGTALAWAWAHLRDLWFLGWRGWWCGRARAGRRV